MTRNDTSPVHKHSGGESLAAEGRVEQLQQLQLPESVD